MDMKRKAVILIYSINDVINEELHYVRLLIESQNFQTG